ncbi:hypothetical protein [Dyadobacter sp. CY343]|uniref:hypothetical protein n=1 Tax=Dyadobacter sp. CY343 TaxID=2907299 RepID=UPI001F2A20A6|nr:hypothetical protein [Dyadobacter sp. CY343]MCE7060253.1 hypothetical protein [Dyadobacter sp. CY343]
MHSTPISKGLATIVKALSKVDDVFRNKQISNADADNSIGKQSDLPVYAHFIQENMIILGQTPGQQLRQSVTLNDLTKRRFLNILNRVAKGQEGVSRQERLFVQQVWSAIGSMH